MRHHHCVQNWNTGVLARSGPAGGSANLWHFRNAQSLNLKFTGDEAKQRIGVPCVLNLSWSLRLRTRRFYWLSIFIDFEKVVQDTSMIELCDVLLYKWRIIMRPLDLLALL